MATTHKGDDLAHALNPFVGTTPAIRETCAAICRLAQTHYRYSVMVCNGGVYEDDLRKPPDDLRRERLAAAPVNIERIEDRIARLVGKLPSNQHKDPAVEFNPSGLAIKILMTDDRGLRREIPVPVDR